MLYTLKVACLTVGFYEQYFDQDSQFITEIQN